MAIVDAKEAASLTGKSTQTLYRHVKAGKLSNCAPGRFDTSELIRVYGPLRGVDQTIETTRPSSMSASASAEVEFLRQQVSQLQADIKELKQESLERERQGIEREKRLMALLEHQQPRDGLFSRLFK